MNLQELNERLHALAPPPERPVEAGQSDAEWDAVEASLGTRLPEDYKAIIRSYGSGDFCDLVLLLNPFSAVDNLNLLYQAGTEPEIYGPMLESYDRGRFGPFSENCPFPIFPEGGGLLPLATDSTGKDFFWLTAGSPDAWTLIRYNWRGGCKYDRIGMCLIEYLVAWIGDELASVDEAVRKSDARLNPVFNPLGSIRNYA